MATVFMKHCLFQPLFPTKDIIPEENLQNFWNLKKHLKVRLTCGYLPAFVMIISVPSLLNWSQRLLSRRVTCKAKC